MYKHPLDTASQTRPSQWGKGVGPRMLADRLVYLDGDKNARIKIGGQPTDRLLINPMDKQPHNPSPTDWAGQIRTLQHNVLVAPSVVRKMHNEEL